MILINEIRIIIVLIQILKQSILKIFCETTFKILINKRNVVVVLINFVINTITIVTITIFVIVLNDTNTIYLLSNLFFTFYLLSKLRQRYCFIKNENITFQFRIKILLYSNKLIKNVIEIDVFDIINNLL